MNTADVRAARLAPVDTFWPSQAAEEHFGQAKSPVEKVGSSRFEL